MELQPQVDTSSLGEVLMLARRRRGLTQEELGKDSGIGQAAIAKLERNRTVPKVTTLCRYLRALGLTPEEELDVWYKIRGNVKEIDWAERLGIEDYDFARSRAQHKLNGGDIYDAYGYIEAMHQLAEDDDQRAWAQVLHGNRFKDLGLFALAEQHYNRATVTVGTGGDPKLLSRILLNLADLHVEQQRYTLADAYVVYALQRELAPSSRAYAYLVKGRVSAARASTGHIEDALSWFDKAESAYQGLKTPALQESGLAWTRLGRAEAMVTAGDAAQSREGLKELRGLATAWGPSDRPLNPELYTRVILTLAERTGDDMALNNAVRLARKHGFRSIIDRVKALGALIVLLCVGLALSGPSAALARPADSGPGSHGDRRGRTSEPRERPQADQPRQDRAETDSIFNFVVGVWQTLLGPMGYEYADAQAKGENEDPGFSDNGPEE